MTSRKIGIAAVVAGGLVATVWLSSVLGQQPGTLTRLGAAGQAGKEVTLTGRIVDFHGYMTGQMVSADPVRCTVDCIRSGVPAGLETETGLVILGQGVTGPMKTLLPFAYQDVEVKGKLFEKAGVKYLDLSSIRKVTESAEEEEEE